MKKLYSSNTFTNGLVQDLNPIMASDSTLTNALNATIVTMNGNENALLNDMGNAKIKDAKLPDGYIPVGTCELGGIIYIASYNPLTKKGQLGSFPSPEYETLSLDNSLPHIKVLDLNTGLLSKVSNETVLGLIGSEVYRTTNNTNIITPIDEESLYFPGDEFFVYSENKVLHDSFLDSKFITYINKREEVIDDAIIQKYEDGKADKIEVYDVFSSKKAGYLFLKTELFNVNSLSYEDRDLEFVETAYDSGFIEEIQISYKGLNYTDDHLYGFYITIEDDEYSYNECITDFNKEERSLLYKISKTNKTLPISIVPIYKYDTTGEEDYIYIARYDKALIENIDFSKVGKGIDNTIWKYYNDGINMNLQFNILDYLSKDQEIESVNLYYLSYKDLIKDTTDRTPFEMLNLQLFGTLNIIFKSPTNLNIPEKFNIEPYKISYDDKTIIEYQEGDRSVNIYNYDGNKIEIPELNRNIIWFRKESEFTSDVNYVQYYSDGNEPPIITITATPNGGGKFQLQWTDKNVTFEILEERPTNNTPNDNTGTSNKYILKYFKENNEVISMFEWQEDDWYDCHTLEKVYIGISTKYTEIKYDQDKGLNIYTFNGIEGWFESVTVENNSKNEYVQFCLNNGACFGPFSLDSKNTQQSDEKPDIEPDTSDDVNPSELFSNENNINFTKVNLESRRNITGLYNVSIPFDLNFILNSLYIFQIAVQLKGKNELLNNPNLTRIMFTNNMYNKDYYNFDDFERHEKIIGPSVNWNSSLDCKVVQISDTLDCDDDKKEYIDENILYLKNGVFDTKFLDILDGTVITEKIINNLIIKLSLSPKVSIDNGFEFEVTNENPFSKTDNYNSNNNSFEYYKEKEIETNIKYTYSSDKLEIENLYKPIIYDLDKSLSNLALYINDDSNNLSYGSPMSIYKDSLTQKSIVVSRYAGLGFQAGGSDSTGGGGYKYICGNFPLGNVGDCLIKGREDYSGRNHEGLSTDDMLSDPSRKGDPGVPNSLETAFGKDIAHTAKNISPLITVEEKVRFPNSEMSDFLVSTAGVKSKLPFFLPILCVNSQPKASSRFQSDGNHYYLDWKNEYSSHTNIEVSFSNTTLMSHFKTLWLFCLTYKDGEYMYMPINVFVPIHNAEANVCKLTSLNISYSNSKLTFFQYKLSVSDYFLSFLTSIYYRDDSESFKKTLGHVGNIINSSGTSIDLNLEQESPKYTIEGNIKYINEYITDIMQNLETKIKKASPDNAYYTSILKYDFPENRRDHILVDCTYENEKYQKYLNLCDNQLSLYVYNPIDNSYLTLDEDIESNLWVRSLNSTELIPINNTSTLDIYRVTKNTLTDSNKQNSEYANEGETAFEISKEKPFIKLNGFITLNIPKDILVYRNNKLYLDLDIINSLNSISMMHYWESNTNSDAEAHGFNRYTIPDLDIFKSFKLDALPYYAIPESNYTFNKEQ